MRRTDAWGYPHTDARWTAWWRPGSPMRMGSTRRRAYGPAPTTSHHMPTSHRLRSRLGRPALTAAVAATAALGALSPAADAAGLTDIWTRWTTSTVQQRDAWVRGLDYTTTSEIWAASEGDGVFQSASAGISFANTPGINSGLIGNADALNVRQVVADGGTLYAATSAGLFRRGAGGSTWLQLGTDKPFGADLIAAVQAVRVSGGTVLAGTASRGLRRSTDSGDSWSQATGIPANESIWHIVGTGPALYAAGGSGVYRSLDGGASWTLRSDGLAGSSVLRIGISPINPLKLYAALGSSGIYRSSNGGETWTAASGSGGGSLPGTVRALLVVPSGFGGDRVIAGTTSGVWATIDDGATWRSMSKTGVPGDPTMNNQIVWSLSFAPTAAPGFLFAGTQANGVFRIPFAPVVAVQGGLLPTLDVGAGAPVVDKIIHATAGQWTGSDPIVFAFQWQRCNDQNASSCSDIAGAKDDTYLPTSADLGKRLRVRVGASNLLGQVGSPIASTITQAVTSSAGSTPSPSKFPTLSPANQSLPWGSTYSINQGQWPIGTSIDYEWERCNENYAGCVVIPNSNSSTYVSLASDVGKTLKAYVLGTASSLTTRSLAGTSFQVIERKPVNTTPPLVLGDAVVGGTLDSAAGGWTGNNITYFRQWQACNGSGGDCSAIPGATGTTFTPLGIHKGATIRVRIEARNGQGSGFVEYATSGPTSVITDAPAGSGGAPAGGSAGGAAGSGAAAGAGAGNGTGVQAGQSQPSLLAPAIIRPKRLRVGATISVPKSLAGATALSFQWLRAGKPIKKATKRSYRLTRADRGKALACRITATLPSGARVVLTTKSLKTPR
jgi:hypothetical protein